MNIECNIIARPYATHAVLKAKQFDYPNSEKRAAILYSEVCIWQIHTDYSQVLGNWGLVVVIIKPKQGKMVCKTTGF